MAGPLLETKIHIPRPRRGLVARPRLIERLGRAAGSALTLVSAPAGFGKTTLLTGWLASSALDGRSVAWLSLDQRDNDPALFWTYVVAALTTAADGDDAHALAHLQSPQPPTEAGLAALLNDLHAIGHDIMLVLDDYHVIESRDVQDGMAFLLEHLPPQVHLVIASRADPALSLARLRGRGELVEIRAGDLRFTPDEAATYLNEVMGLVLTPRDVAVLEARTEGWIAALQLAALSLQGRDDIAGFIAGFAGDDRYIVDYLAEEVLQRQPELVRAFLLQTSVLSRLTGSLCDAVTGQEGGKAMLEALDRGNLFLVSLDDRRQWYRYHHLFADVLRARLQDEQPVRVLELHRRASEWYEQHGERPEAIRHAMAGGDLDRAADLVELAIPPTRQHRQDATLRGWLDSLPDEAIRVRPVLSNAWAGSRLVRGEVEGVEARLRDAERWLDATGGTTARPPGMVVADEELFRTLPGSVAVHRAGHALILDDVAGTMTHARRVLDLVDADDHISRGAAAALLGLAYWRTGDLDAAHSSYTDAMGCFERIGHYADVLGSAITLADLRTTQGRLRDARTAYERGLDVARRHGPSVVRGAADMHVGLSAVLRERNELGAARQHLLTSRELGEHAGLPQNRYRWRVSMARVRQAEGDLDAAVELLDEAERLYLGDFSPDVRPVAALRAQMWISQGALDKAQSWVRERGLSVEDELSYPREFEHLTLARLRLGQYAADRAARSMDEATELLDRLLQAAEEGHRAGTVLEILVLQAVAHHLRGGLSAALAVLRRALAMAEPEGYVRVFVDEGAPMVSLLDAIAKPASTPSYVRRLLAAATGTDNRPPVRQSLVEPLSRRELDVLRLLATDLDGPDIARALVVSLNTVRTHTKNIYAKLGVTNRRAAVRRADELGLTSRTRER